MEWDFLYPYKISIPFKSTDRMQIFPYFDPERFNIKCLGFAFYFTEIILKIKIAIRVKDCISHDTYITLDTQLYRLYRLYATFLCYATVLPLIQDRF